MKRLFLFTLTILCCAKLTGCAKTMTHTPLPITVPTPREAINENIGSCADGPILETETGYYYQVPSGCMSLRYCDKTTGKNIFLCNKPECKHKGESFCVATTNRYTPIYLTLYDNRLYANVLDTSNGSLEYKLLEVSLDGSQLTELVTYYTNANDEFDYDLFAYANSMVIHRNKVIFQLSLNLNKDFERLEYFGTIIYDLETGELVSVYPETISSENPQWSHIQVQNDYVYYVVNEPHKHFLHRYNLATSQDELLQPQIPFIGEYFLFNDKLYFFRTNFGHLWEYDLENHTNQEIDLLHSLTERQLPTDYLEDTEKMSPEVQELFYANQISEDPNYQIINGKYYRIILEDKKYNAMSYHADEDYIYIEEYNFSHYAEDTGTETIHDIIHVFDKSLQEITHVEIPQRLGSNTTSSPSSEWSFRFLGNTVYVYQKYRTSDVYRISKTDFLSGRQNYELAYSITPDAQTISSSNPLPPDEDDD